MLTANFATSALDDTKFIQFITYEMRAAIDIKFSFQKGLIDVSPS